MSDRWKYIAETLSVLWCRFMHDGALWPIHGTYRYRICARRYAVPWAGTRLLVGSGSRA
jgi:hypothetical protein